MRSRRLAVTGAIEFTPRVFADDRGTTVAPFQHTQFTAALGHPLFAVAQTLHSSSCRDVVRGVHFAAVPPGTAKYVYCPRGSVLDIVVDLRVGSPTFGRWDTVELDDVSFRSVYVPVGVGHAFVTLAPDTVVSYLMSGEYDAARERTLSALDPDLGLPIPAGLNPIMSDRDRAAPTLAGALAAGLLPDYADC
jgi:epimerase EvaD